jgi:hypothetical protein
MPFSRRLCARALPVRSKQMTAELDLRQKPPVVEPGAIKILHGKASSLRGAKRRSNPESAAVTLDCFAPLAMTKRKAERRQTLCNNLRASRRGTAPKGRLACRRSTTALAAATERHRSASAYALPGKRSERTVPMVRKTARLFRGRYPRLPVPVQRVPTRRPVFMPAGRIVPKPPGSGGDKPPPAGTAPLRPPVSPGGRHGT